MSRQDLIAMYVQLDKASVSGIENMARIGAVGNALRTILERGTDRGDAHRIS